VADEKVRTAFRGLVKRRAEGTPVAYLVGYREFYSLRFRVTPAVLIPRPETESLVVAARDWATQNPAAQKSATERPLEIADVGTGSGVLAVSAARFIASARVTALDISPEALEVARQNATEHGVADQIEFVLSDLFAAVAPEKRFDLILANPPYVSTSEMEQLPASIRNYEPRRALEAGDDGLAVIRPLVAQSAERLAPAGQLLFEVSPMLAEAARKVVADEPRLVFGATIKDLAGLARVIQATRAAT